ncbi:hypothetical protein F5880DRAFT_1616377 [Lentinula raphanica]|nr:hypothetical protein F5880DRAFT_1616377 [Lentinula raphanica]
MPRRSKSAIHSLYASRKSRPTSTADGPGYLYAFSDTGHKWKVGIPGPAGQVPVSTGQQQVTGQDVGGKIPAGQVTGMTRPGLVKTLSPSRRWKDPIAVPRRRRAGAIIGSSSPRTPVRRQAA